MIIVKCEKLFCEIDSLYEEYLGVLEDICNIESPTDCKEGLDNVGKYFAAMAEKHGWDIETLELENAGNPICITMNKHAKGEPVTLSAHIDTVHEKGRFGYPPVKQDEEKIYGPGVFDDKGGAVAAFLAMHALENVGFTSRPVKLILQTDEEKGSVPSGRKTVEFMCEMAKGSKAFLNCEAYHGKTTLIRKGFLRYEIEITGKRAQNNAYSTGASAIAQAAHMICELEKFKDGDGLECNCGKIEGGSNAFSVADKCTFLVSFRFTSPEQMESAKETVEKLCRNVIVDGCECAATQNAYRQAMPLVQRNLDLLDEVNKIYEENGLPKMDYLMSYGGSDATNITNYGIPCLDSLGTAGGGMHTADEFAYKKSLHESAKRVASVIYCI